LTDEDRISRYLANLADERDSAYLYRVLADADSDERLSGVYRRLAGTEEKLLRFWEERLREAGEVMSERRVGRQSPPAYSRAWLVCSSSGRRLRCSQAGASSSGGRQVLVGATAAVLTYVLGALLGTAVGG